MNFKWIASFNCNAGKDEIIFNSKFIFTEVEILLEARNNELRWESMNVFKMIKNSLSKLTS